MFWYRIVNKVPKELFTNMIKERFNSFYTTLPNSFKSLKVEIKVKEPFLPYIRSDVQITISCNIKVSSFSIFPAYFSPFSIKVL